MAKIPQEILKAYEAIENYEKEISKPMPKFDVPEPTRYREKQRWMDQRDAYWGIELARRAALKREVMVLVNEASEAIARHECLDEPREENFGYKRSEKLVKMGEKIDSPMAEDRYMNELLSDRRKWEKRGGENVLKFQIAWTEWAKENNIINKVWKYIPKKEEPKPVNTSGYTEGEDDVIFFH